MQFNTAFRRRILFLTQTNLSLELTSTITSPYLPRGKIKQEEGLQLIRKRINNGINYIDTTWTYHRGESEVIVGSSMDSTLWQKVEVLLSRQNYL